MTASKNTGAVAIIPVRVDSQRLPGKALLDESGQALFLHTCQQAAKANCFDEVLVATDSERVQAAAKAAGIRSIETSHRPRTGTERCAEAAEKFSALGLQAEVVVNIQGDWPEIHPQDLQQMVQPLLSGSAQCSTLAAALDDREKIADPNVVKVVRDLAGNALYFSRSPIPYYRDRQGSWQCWRHIGVYGFTLPTLQRIPDLPSSGLDEAEGLEQLKFLENGIGMQVLEAQGEPWGIEARQDYDAFLTRLAAGQSKNQTS